MSRESVARVQRGLGVLLVLTMVFVESGYGQEAGEGARWPFM